MRKVVATLLMVTPFTHLLHPKWPQFLPTAVLWFVLHETALTLLSYFHTLVSIFSIALSLGYSFVYVCCHVCNCRGTQHPVGDTPPGLLALIGYCGYSAGGSPTYNHKCRYLRLKVEEAPTRSGTVK